MINTRVQFPRMLMGLNAVALEYMPHCHSQLHRPIHTYMHIHVHTFTGSVPRGGASSICCLRRLLIYYSNIVCTTCYSVGGWYIISCPHCVCFFTHSTPSWAELNWSNWIYRFLVDFQISYTMCCDICCKTCTGASHFCVEGVNEPLIFQ